MVSKFVTKCMLRLAIGVCLVYKIVSEYNSSTIIVIVQSAIV